MAPNCSKKVVWKMMMEIKRSIQNVGGFIFGGMVRDQIIHDHHATCFYDSIVGKNFIDIDGIYSDPNYLPEHSDRCIVPEDIDCFMTTTQLKKLYETELKTKNYSVRIKKDQQANLYFLKENVTELQHTKLEIKFCVNKILESELSTSKYRVNVDVIHTDNPAIDMYERLSANFDFECNSLILTPGENYRLCASMNNYISAAEKSRKIVDIIEDIKMKKAKILPDLHKVPSYRVAKMYHKGWTIEGRSFHTIKQSIPYDGHCLICHETIGTDVQHVKDKHCDARFHPKCYVSMIKHDGFQHKCPLCMHSCCITVNEETALTTITDIQTLRSSLISSVPAINDC